MSKLAWGIGIGVGTVAAAVKGYKEKKRVTR